MLTLLLCLISFPRLGFSADRQALFRTTEEEQAQRADFQRRFGDWMDLIVVLDGASGAEREKAALTLGQMMGSSPELFEDVRATLEMPGLAHQALYFLSLDELRAIDEALARHQGVMGKLSRDGWYGFLETREPLPSTPDEQQNRFSEAWEKSVEGRGSGELSELFPHMEVPERAFFTDGPARHLVFFRSSQPLAAMEKLGEFESRLDYPGRLVMLGQPLLQAQEEAETVRDAALSTVLSILLVLLLLVHGFRELARPRLAFFGLTFALLWSTCWAALAVGKLNIITVNFLSITVGIGIDFSIHYLARYAEERESGRDALDAMTATWQSTGMEIFVGALATSMAFFALMLTDFQAVKELGLITGVAIMLCFLSVVLLLPALIVWHEERNGFSHLNVSSMPWLSVMERWLRTNPRKSLAAGLLVTVALGAFGTRTRFDYNLLNLQSDNFESVVYEKESGFSTLAAYLIAENAEEALEMKARLEKLPSVSRVTTVADLFPRQPEQKADLVRSIVKRVRSIPMPSFDPDEEPDWNRLQKLTAGWEGQSSSPKWVETLADSGPGPVEAVWRQMQAHLHEELQMMLSDMRGQRTEFRMAEWKASFPALLRYSNEDGKTLLRIQGKHSLWERDSLTEFVSEVQTVTDRGMGPPFLIRDYLEQMRKSYFDAVRYAIVAIVVLLVLYFRSGLRTFIALVPKVVGTVGMLGAMGICGVDFNPANCMALPLTLGIGLIFGIHAVHRCLEHPDELLVEGSTGKSISLAAWTDIVSFGTMLTAANPGIFSIGFVMAVGVGANLIATYLLVPPLVVLFRDRLIRPV